MKFSVSVFSESLFLLQYETNNNHNKQNTKYTVYYSWPPTEKPSPENQLAVEKEQGLESMRQNITSLVHNEQKPKQEKGQEIQ